MKKDFEPLPNLPLPPWHYRALSRMHEEWTPDSLIESRLDGRARHLSNGALIPQAESEGSIVQNKHLCVGVPRRRDKICVFVPGSRQIDSVPNHFDRSSWPDNPRLTKALSSITEVSTPY